MPALNFQRQFADAVRCGYKRQTIRAKRKHTIRIGDTLYLQMGHPLVSGPFRLCPRCFPCARTAIDCGK